MSNPLARRNAVRILVALLALPLISWIMDRCSMRVEIDSYLFSYAFWANAIPVAIVLALLILVTRRVLWPSLVLLVGLVALYAVNLLKLRYLASPLSLADYYFVRDMDWGSARLFLRYVDLKLVGGGCVLAVAMLVALWRHERPMSTRSRPLLRFCLFMLIACGGYLLVPGPAGAAIYGGGRLRVLPYDGVATQFRAGLLSDLIHAAHDMAGAFNEPVDRSAVHGLLASIGVPIEAQGQSAPELPDVVVIQSESFFNPDLIEQVGDTHVLLPRLHQAMDEGMSGQMIVPTFGGGTIRTEFEVLTGIPLAAYQKVQFPYLQMSRSNMPSMARVFASAGYQTAAVHGNSGDFWRRYSAFRSLGFDKFITAKEFGEDAYRDGWYLSDHSMTDEIIGQLGTNDRPKFVFAISIEAHGPYRRPPVKDTGRREQIAVPADFSEDAREEYSRYAYHISDADHEFGRLWDYLKARHRPFVLVFYGDHLPGFQYIYDQAKFRNGLAANLQHVPWVAVGSGIGKSGKRDLFAWMLSSEVLQLADVKGTPYLTLVGTAGDRVLHEPDGSPASNTMLEGLYSAARLDLNGEFDSFDKAADHAE